MPKLFCSSLCRAICASRSRFRFLTKKNAPILNPAKARIPTTIPAATTPALGPLPELCAACVALEESVVAELEISFDVSVEDSVAAGLVADVSLDNVVLGRAVVITDRVSVEAVSTVLVGFTVDLGGVVAAWVGCRLEASVGSASFSEVVSFADGVGTATGGVVAGASVLGHAVSSPKKHLTSDVAGSQAEVKSFQNPA